MIVGDVVSSCHAHSEKWPRKQCKTWWSLHAIVLQGKPWELRLLSDNVKTENNVRWKRRRLIHCNSIKSLCSFLRLRSACHHFCSTLFVQSSAITYSGYKCCDWSVSVVIFSLVLLSARVAVYISRNFFPFFFFTVCGSWCRVMFFLYIITKVDTLVWHHVIL